MSRPTGRPPKPHHLKVIEGNPGGRRLTPLPKAPPLKPRMPADLSDGAKRVWRWLVPKLDDVGILTPVDALYLEMLCDVVARARSARGYADAGTLTAGRKGEPVRNPAAIELRQWLDLVDRFGSRFGLNPADRVRLAVGDPHATTLDLDRLLEDPGA